MLCITRLKDEMSTKFWRDIKREIIEKQNSDMKNKLRNVRRRHTCDAFAPLLSL